MGVRTGATLSTMFLESRAATNSPEGR
jgi:hypothetical protein